MTIAFYNEKESMLFTHLAPQMLNGIGCCLLDSMCRGALKGIVHPRIQIHWRWPHLIGEPRFRWVCLQQKRFGEIEHYITCSPVDPLL